MPVELHQSQKGYLYPKRSKDMLTYLSSKIVNPSCYLSYNIIPCLKAGRWRIALFLLLQARINKSTTPTCLESVSGCSFQNGSVLSLTGQQMTNTCYSILIMCQKSIWIVISGCNQKIFVPISLPMEGPRLWERESLSPGTVSHLCPKAYLYVSVCSRALIIFWVY